MGKGTIEKEVCQVENDFPHEFLPEKYFRKAAGKRQGKIEKGKPFLQMGLNLQNTLYQKRVCMILLRREGTLTSLFTPRGTILGHPAPANG